MDNETIKLHMRDTRWGKMVYPAVGMWVEESLERYGEYNLTQALVLQHCMNLRTTAVDVGANIGALTIPMSLSAKEVIAFEPQPVLADVLRANVGLAQTNVKVLPFAVGSEAGEINMPRVDYNQRGNFGGIGRAFWEAKHPDNEPHKVSVFTLDAQVSAASFVKIDVEGMELDVLRGATRLIKTCRPGLMVEADRTESAPEVIQWLLDQDYIPRWVITTLYTPGNFDHNPRNVFGTTCSFDVLAYPRGVDSPIHGLRDALPTDEIGTCTPDQRFELGDLR